MKSLYWNIIRVIPFLRPLFETRNTQTPITIKAFLLQKLLGFNRNAYWQVHPSSTIVAWQNICIGVEVSPGIAPGCYIQGIGKIFIGDYTQISANVGIISANHNYYDNREYIVRSIKIGSYCWLGMNSVILPGVELGDFTIVGAGAIVTKSFSEGYCVIAGNPARLVKKLDPAVCVKHKSKHEYIGYIKKIKFEVFRNKYLKV